MKKSVVRAFNFCLDKCYFILRLRFFRGIPLYNGYIIQSNENFVNIVELHEIIILCLPIIIVEFHKIIGRI